MTTLKDILRDLISEARKEEGIRNHQNSDEDLLEEYIELIKTRLIGE